MSPHAQILMLCGLVAALASAVHARRQPTTVALMVARFLQGTALGVCLAVACTGCGSADWEQQAHRAMNRLTDYADPLYGAVVIACDAREGGILSSDADIATKRAQIQTTRERCDVAIQAFEALIEAQRATRVAIDAAAAGQTSWRYAADAGERATVALRAAKDAINALPWLRDAAEAAIKRAAR